MQLRSVVRSIAYLLFLFLIGNTLAAPNTNVSTIQSLGDPVRPLLLSGDHLKVASSTINYHEVTGAVLNAWYFLGVITSCLLNIFGRPSSAPVPSGSYECADHGVLLSIAEQGTPLDYGFVWLILFMLRDTFELYQVGNLKFTIDSPGAIIAATGYLRYTGFQAGNLSLPTGGQGGNVSLTR